MSRASGASNRRTTAGSRYPGSRYSSSSSIRRLSQRTNVCSHSWETDGARELRRLFRACQLTGAVVGDVDAIAAQIGHAVPAAPGPAGVDEYPVAHRGSAVAEPVMGQGLPDAA